MEIDDNNNIVILTDMKICIYNSRDALIKSWYLLNESETEYARRDISCNGNEICILECYMGDVHVFYYEGELIRTWTNFVILEHMDPQKNRHISGHYFYS